MKLFFPPEIVIVPFPVIFLNSKKKIHGWRRKICAPHGQHIPVSRGFSEEYEEMGGVFCRGFFYQMSASYLILGRKRFKNIIFSSTHSRLCCAVSPCFALPIYSPWQSKADHLQRQALSAWRLERFVGNCSALSAERN